MGADYAKECERCGAKLRAGDTHDGRQLRYRDWIVCRACRDELLAPLNREAPNADA